MDAQRMLIWLALSVLAYAASAAAGTDHPQVQVVLYKVGHVTLLAWVGYWISRQALGRIYDHTNSTRVLARGVIMAGVIVGGSLGL